MHSPVLGFSFFAIVLENFERDNAKMLAHRIKRAKVRLQAAAQRAFIRSPFCLRFQKAAAEENRKKGVSNVLKAFATVC
jgi:hypothetical protein